MWALSDIQHFRELLLLLALCCGLPSKVQFGNTPALKQKKLFIHLPVKLFIFVVLGNARTWTLGSWRAGARLVDFFGNPQQLLHRFLQNNNYWLLFFITYEHTHSKMSSTKMKEKTVFFSLSYQLWKKFRYTRPKSVCACVRACGARVRVCVCIFL